MVRRFYESEFDLLTDKALNRYAAFEQVRKFLQQNGILWEHLFELMRKSDRCDLAYDFGDFSICFERISHRRLFRELDDCEETIDLTVAYGGRNSRKTSVFTYSMEELSMWKRTRQSRLDDGTK